MKLKLMSMGCKVDGEVNVPIQFSEPLRVDIIKRAVMAIRSHKRQAYGPNKLSGRKYSSQLSKRRKKYRGMYGSGISRTPRKILSRRGTRMYWVGATVPNTVGGRRAHPPKSEKKYFQKINKKERRKAIRSALGATLKRDLVLARGHKTPETYPFVISSKVQDFSKAKELNAFLTKLGLKDELSRVKIKSIRAGKGKMRGRKYRKKVGPLIVVDDICNLLQCNNIPGINIVPVSNLNAELLAPGADSGRLTIFTDKAMNKLDSEKLFM